MREVGQPAARRAGVVADKRVRRAGLARWVVGEVDAVFNDERSAFAVHLHTVPWRVFPFARGLVQTADAAVSKGEDAKRATLSRFVGKVERLWRAEQILENRQGVAADLEKAHHLSAMGASLGWRQVHGVVDVGGGGRAKLRLGHQLLCVLNRGVEGLLKAYLDKALGLVARRLHLLDLRQRRGRRLFDPDVTARAQHVNGHRGVLGPPCRVVIEHDKYRVELFLFEHFGIIGVPAQGAKLPGKELGPLRHEIADGHQLYRRILKARQDTLEGMLTAADKCSTYVLLVLMVEGHLAESSVSAE